MRLAGVAYTAYCVARGWKAYNGDQLPQWPQVDTVIQQAWCAAVKATVNEFFVVPSHMPAGGVGDGCDRIAAERAGQITIKRYGSERDDAYVHQELAMMAAELAAHGTEVNLVLPDGSDSWGIIKKWKDDRVHQLVVAGALIAAEIDRLRRLEEKKVKGT